MIYGRLRELFDQSEDLNRLVNRISIRFSPHEPLIRMTSNIAEEVRRTPSPLDFVEEGATIETVTRRLAQIEKAIGDLRPPWTTRAVELAGFKGLQTD